MEFLGLQSSVEGPAELSPGSPQRRKGSVSGLSGGALGAGTAEAGLQQLSEEVQGGRLLVQVSKKLQCGLRCCSRANWHSSLGCRCSVAEAPTAAGSRQEGAGSSLSSCLQPVPGNPGRQRCGPHTAVLGGGFGEPAPQSILEHCVTPKQALLSSDFAFWVKCPASALSSGLGPPPFSARPSLT